MSLKLTLRVVVVLACLYSGGPFVPPASSEVVTEAVKLVSIIEVLLKYQSSEEVFKYIFIYL